MGPERILLVDDDMTRGTTLLACRETIRTALPDADIRAFAVVRTMSNELITEMLRPVVGNIAQIGNRGRRTP